MPYQEVRYGESGFGWRDDGGPHDLAVVFVHGWGGDARSTWTWSPPRWRRWLFWDRRPNVFLMNLMTASPNLRCNYYAYAHSGGPISRVNIQTLADGLRSFVASNLVDERRIVLIAHSLGGLICRKAVLDMLHLAPADRLKVVGILMMGTPNNGTELGRLPSWSRSGLEMIPMSAFLADLNRSWIERISNGGDPSQDISQRTTLKCRTIVGDIDRVVSVTSGGTLSLLGDYEVIARTGHLALCKPTDENHPAFVQIKRFILECRAEWPNRPLARAAAVAGFRAASRVTNAAEWLFREKETIKITPQTGGGGPFATREDVFRCDIRCQRWGYPSRQRLNILIHVGPQRPDERADYVLSIGQGTWNQAEFANFVQTLRNVSGRANDYSWVVESISIRRGNESADYHLVADDVTVRNSYVLLPYECASALCDGTRNEEVTLDLRLRNWISKRQGWYRYTAGNAVINSLTVELDTPFPVVGKDSYPHEQADRRHAPAGTSETATITVRGPVEPGSWVDWTFKQ